MFNSGGMRKGDHLRYFSEVFTENFISLAYFSPAPFRSQITLYYFARACFENLSCPP